MAATSASSPSGRASSIRPSCRNARPSLPCGSPTSRTRRSSARRSPIPRPRRLAFLSSMGQREAIAFGEGVATTMRLKFERMDGQSDPRLGKAPRRGAGRRRRRRRRPGLDRRAAAQRAQAADEPRLSPNRSARSVSPAIRAIASPRRLRQSRCPTGRSRFRLRPQAGQFGSRPRLTELEPFALVRLNSQAGRAHAGHVVGLRRTDDVFENRSAADIWSVSTGSAETPLRWPSE